MIFDPTYLTPVHIAFAKAQHRKTFACCHGVSDWRRAFNRNQIRRAYAAYRRNIVNPGDCEDDITMLAALAVAEAMIGRGPAWIPKVQRIACDLAD